MTRNLAGYLKDRPMHVNRATVSGLVRKGEELFGLKRGKHHFTIDYDKESPGTYAEYDAKRRRFLSPRTSTEAVMFHEAVHYLMHTRGTVFSDRTLYGGLLDEMLAFIGTMESYGYDHRFRLESSDEYAGENGEYADALQLARVHRALEMKLPPPESMDDMEDIAYVTGNIGQDLLDFTAHAGTFEQQTRVEAGEFLATDMASRLLRMGIASRELFGIVEEAIRNGQPSVKLYFQLVGTAKLITPDFFTA